MNQLIRIFSHFSQLFPLLEFQHLSKIIRAKCHSKAFPFYSKWMVMILLSAWAAMIFGTELIHIF